MNNQRDALELETQVKQTYKFLLKMDELQAVQKEMIRFMRSLTDIYPNELKQAFRELHASLKRFENDPYEKRSFLYLDILSWLESKIENQSIGEVIRKKASSLIRLRLPQHIIWVGSDKLHFYFLCWVDKYQRSGMKMNTSIWIWSLCPIF